MELLHGISLGAVPSARNGWMYRTINSSSRTRGDAPGFGDPKVRETNGFAQKWDM
jgi:hypothetical protein